MGADEAPKHHDQARQLSPAAIVGDISAFFNPDTTSTPAATDGGAPVATDGGSSVSYVFVTASPTFSGPAGGFVTLTPSNFAQPATTTSSPAATTAQPTTMSVVTSQQTQASTASPVKPTSQTTTKSASSVATPATTSTTANSAVAAQTSAATPSSAPASISGGAVAGIVICLLLVFGAAIAGGIYLYRLRRAKALDEKDPNPFSDHAAEPAPPMSLRPITPPLSHQTEWVGALPNGANGASDAANGAANGAVAAGGLAGAASAAPAHELEKVNPFGNHAAVDANGSGIPAPLRIGTPTGEGAEIAAAGGAAAVIAAAAAGGATARGPATPGLNSPGAVLGAAAAGAAASGRASPAGGAATNNVHRIQLDFKPSMDDELELRAGQLVRLLHEYDDGWALCIRLDRSQQGVAPRTCLSTRPVKPRQPPGTPPQMRLPLQGSQPRSNFPPALSPGAPKPSPIAPFQSQPRSMSPGPYGGGQSQRPRMPIAAPERPRSNPNPTVNDLRPKMAASSPMNPNVPATAAVPAPMTEAAATAPHDDVSPSSSCPQSPGFVTRKPVPGQAP